MEINPDAKFFTPLDDGSEHTHYGKIVAALEDGEPGVLQFSTKRDAFILHPSLNMGDHKTGELIEVEYKNGDVSAKSSRSKDKGGRGD